MTVRIALQHRSKDNTEALLDDTHTACPRNTWLWSCTYLMSWRHFAHGTTRTAWQTSQVASASFSLTNVQDAQFHAVISSVFLSPAGRSSVFLVLLWRNLGNCVRL